MDGFLEVLLRKYQKLRDEIQALQNGSRRDKILKSVNMHRVRSSWMTYGG